MAPTTSYASEYLTPMMVCTCRRYDLKYMWVVCGVWFSGVFCVLCVASSYVVCDVCRVWCDMYRVCVALSGMFVLHVLNLFRVFDR